MKNKKLVYVLLPATIAVWAIAFMRIYRYFNPEGVQKYEMVYTVPEENERISIPDTFSIGTDYRDPFLGKSQKKIALPASSSSQVKSKEKPAKEPNKQVPEVQVFYSGMIRNQKSSSQLAMIRINGESKMMKPGDISGGIKLNRIFRDSVEIIIDKQKKIVRK